MTPNLGLCGPASLKIVLAYYGVEKSEDELAKMCKTTKGLGTKDIDIKAAAEKLGFKAVIKNNSDFKTVTTWLKAGVPVILDWFTTGRPEFADVDVPGGHFSIAVGMDDRFIFLEDPEIGRTRRIEKNEFIRVWFDFPGWLIKRDELIIRQLIAIYK